MPDREKGITASALSGVFFGLIPIVILSVSRSSSAGSSFILMIRMTVAAVILLPFSFRYFKNTSIRFKELAGILVASTLITATSLLLYTAYLYIPSGVGISIHYTYPIVCTLVSIILYKERPGAKVITALLISVAGTVMLSDVSGLSDSAGLGIMLAGLSSLTFSGYLIWVERKNLGRINAIPYTQILSSFSAVILLVFNVISGNLNVELASAHIIPLISVGVLAALAIILQAVGVKAIGSVYVSIFGTLEPIVCAICGVIFLDESLTLMRTAGTVLVIVAVVLISLSGSSKAEH